MLASAISHVLGQRCLATAVARYLFSHPVKAVKTLGFPAVICYFIQGSMYTVLLSSL